MPSSGGIIVAAALLFALVLGGAGIASLFGSSETSSRSASLASDTFDAISDGSAPASPPPEPDAAETKTTAAGNRAIGIVRSAEERKATSASANNITPGPKTVYLTFDDGPSTNTYRILDILNAYGVKATWFVKADQPQVEYVKDIWEADHQVAIHTYSHDYRSVYASASAYWSDLHQAGSIIENYLGFEPTLVRFPGGSRNSYNGAIIDGILRDMESSGYHYFDWNVSSGDGGTHDAEFIVDYTLGRAEGCHSCCVLMHDSTAKDSTVEALPAIIEWFIDNDFEFDVLLADSFGYHF